MLTLPTITIKITHSLSHCVSVCVCVCVCVCACLCVSVHCRSSQVSVSNSGPWIGDHVVLLFVHTEVTPTLSLASTSSSSSSSCPRQQLLAFTRVAAVPVAVGVATGRVVVLHVQGAALAAVAAACGHHATLAWSLGPGTARIPIEGAF